MQLRNASVSMTIAQRNTSICFHYLRKRCKSRLRVQ
ncbi:hypothetical protein [Roseovarius sp. M141]